MAQKDKEKEHQAHDPLLSQTATVQREPEPPPDLKDFKGEYYNQDALEDEPYGLKKVPDDPWGRTHHLRNEKHYWSGTEAEFKAHFDKEPKEKVDERKAKEQEKEQEKKEKEREREERERDNE